MVGSIGVALGMKWTIRKLNIKMIGIGMGLGILNGGLQAWTAYVG